ncbi:NADH-quinone oxidoreductase subunit NuoE [Acuticoccus sp.]|uniref:NADH-quinone oxidoreductase subunit NuoE n=1 Tax=Acuticoccus sp. TaxID=1904378 RepID=UPI003B5168DF
MAVRRLADEQPSTFEFTPQNRAWAEAKIRDYPEGRQSSAVIPVLWRAQAQHHGWLPEPAIRLVADMLGMPYIRVFEIATFYTMFQLKPVGSVAHVGVCGTTPCMLRGSDDIVAVCRERIAPQPFQLSDDGRFSWEEVECAGACVNAPMVQIGPDTYEDLTADSFKALLDDLEEGRVPTPGPQSARRGSEPASGATTLTSPAKDRHPHASPAPDQDEPSADVDPTSEAARDQLAAHPDPRDRTTVEATRPSDAPPRDPSPVAPEPKTDGRASGAPDAPEKQKSAQDASAEEDQSRDASQEAVGAAQEAARRAEAAAAGSEDAATDAETSAEAAKASGEEARDSAAEAQDAEERADEAGTAAERSGAEARTARTDAGEHAARSQRAAEDAQASRSAASEHDAGATDAAEQADAAADEAAAGADRGDLAADAAENARDEAALEADRASEAERSADEQADRAAPAAELAQEPLEDEDAAIEPSLSGEAGATDDQRGAAAPAPSDRPARPAPPAPDQVASDRADQVGERPAATSREDHDQPDELQRISGIGPVIEKTLHELGIFKFHQLAEWTDANKEWVNAYLAFKGRIDRERWVEQAREIVSQDDGG